MIIVLRFIFLFLDFLVPKNSRIVIFCGKASRDMSAATWIPFLEAQKFNEFDSYYTLEGNQNHKNVINPWGLSGFWKILKARYVFLTHGPGDVPYAFWSPRKIVTYVGHGIPLKNIFLKSQILTRKDKLVCGIELPSYAHVVASSDADARNLADCFGKDLAQVLVTGLPRNDLLFQATTDLKSQYPGKKLVLYAPTFRDIGSTRYFPFEDKDLSALNEYLKDRGMVIFIRGHRNDRGQIDARNTEIKELSSEVVPEIQFVLNEFDYLITDYSSIFVDFLLLDRPIAFIPYDQKEYIANRGFSYDYESLKCGPSLKSQAQLLEFLQTEKISDSYSLKREEIRSMFHRFQDAKSSERLLKRVLG